MAAGIATGFVRKLYRILDLESDAIIAWDSAGDSFSIHDADALNDKVLPRYFRGRISAFRQQLVDHGFEQLECEDNETREAYRHVHFVRGRPAQLSLIVRVPKPKRKQHAAATTAAAAAAAHQARQRPATAASTATAVALSALSTSNGSSSNNDTPALPVRLQVRPPPRLLTVTLNGVKRASPSGSNAPPKRQRTAEPSATLPNTAAYSNGSAPSPAAPTNPLFSDASALSFARLAESGLLPHSSDLPEPISYLSRPPVVTTTTTARMLEPPMFSDDLFRSALLFLASGSTTGVDTAATATAPAATSSAPTNRTDVDTNDDMTVPSTLLSMLLASSTSAAPVYGSSATPRSTPTGAANPLFSDQSTADDDDDQDSIWNLLVASSVDRVKSAINDIETPAERLRVILAERERLEAQRSKLFEKTGSTAAATGSTAASASSLNPLFAKPKPSTTASSLNPLFAKPKAAAPAATTATASAARASNEDDLWRLLMSSSIDSFRRLGDLDG